MKKTVVSFVSLAVSLGLAVCANAGQAFPEIVPLPDEWGPEGIEVGRGTDFYAGQGIFPLSPGQFTKAICGPARAISLFLLNPAAPRLG